MPSSRSKRELKRDTLIRALKDDALAKLDALHGKLESERAVAAAAAAVEREKVDAERAHAEYLQAFQDAKTLERIRDFETRYGDNDRITAESAEGYSIVSRYRIDCSAGDGRILPLLNALYASIVSLDGNGVQMRFHIQNRGQKVRITSEVTKNGKPMGPRQLYYEINEWGDLRAIVIRSKAVLNACHGF